MSLHYPCHYHSPINFPWPYFTIPNFLLHTLCQACVALRSLCPARILFIPVASYTHYVPHPLGSCPLCPTLIRLMPNMPHVHCASCLLSSIPCYAPYSISAMPTMSDAHYAPYLLCPMQFVHHAYYTQCQLCSMPIMPHAHYSPKIIITNVHYISCPFSPMPIIPHAHYPHSRYAP